MCNKRMYNNHTTPREEDAFLNKMALLRLSHFEKYSRQTCFIDYRDEIGGGFSSALATKRRKYKSSTGAKGASDLRQRLYILNRGFFHV